MSAGAESLQGTDELGEEYADSRRMCRQEIGLPTRDESIQFTIELRAWMYRQEEPLRSR